MLPDGYNFVKWCREIAQSTYDWQKRDALQKASDDLQYILREFSRTWSQDDLRKVNGAWARCHVAIDAIRPGGGSDPVGGRLSKPLSLQETRPLRAAFG